MTVSTFTTALEEIWKNWNVWRHLRQYTFSFCKMLLHKTTFPPYLQLYVVMVCVCVTWL